jgi:hypothetical protein
VKRGLLVIASLLIAGSVTGSAADPRVPAEGAFAVSLLVDATQIVPYEPLWVTSSLINTTTDTVKLMGQGMGDNHLLISSAGGEYEDWGMGLGSWKLYPDARVVDFLRPGQWCSEIGFLFFEPWDPYEGPRRFAFGEPGEYRLKLAVLIWGGERLETEPWPVTVQEPSEEEVAAAKLLTDPKVLDLIAQTGRPSLGVPMLEQLVRDYPESRLADHAHFFLGEYYRIDPDGGPKQPVGQYGFAAQHFAAVSDRIPPLRVRALVSYLLVMQSDYDLRSATNVSPYFAELKPHEALIDQLGLWLHYSAACTDLDRPAPTRPSALSR